MIMEKLNEKKWSAISIGNQFKLCRGRESKSTVKEGGKLPFVSAKKTDNGYRMFVEQTKTEINGNTITLNNNGDGGAGFGYYQPYKYTVDVNTTALIPLPNVSMNPFIGLFFVGCFSWMHDYFGNACTLSNKRAEISKIMIPVNDLGNPDYVYMDKYVKKICNEMITKYKEYIVNRILEIGKEITIESLSKKEWHVFVIGNLFDISRPFQRNKDTYDEGDIPFVASGALNNGVIKYCNPRDGESLDNRCCITVSPVDGSAFYQPIDFLGRGGAGSSILMLRSKNLNEFNGQFIARMVRQTCSKYTYGHMGNKDSIKRERIMLPVNDAGDPDYVYMEQYAKNMMLRKYKQYLAYLDKKAEAEL